MNILAIDIGGTKTAFAVCQFATTDATSATPSLTVSSEAHWPSQAQGSFEAVLQKWCKSMQNVTLHSVGIGVAGPIQGDFPAQTAVVTNLGWTLDAKNLSAILGGPPVYLCNDMEAHGWGLLSLDKTSLHTLNEGVHEKGCKTLIAAGTGLGESFIAWDGTQHVPMGGEGGHTAFSPSNDEEDLLLKYLRAKYKGHVSWERVLGGRDGFRNLAEFMMRDHPSDILQQLNIRADLEDWGSVITGAAASGNPFCIRLLQLYATLYGREAANLAVKCMPYAGVYIGGGIAPKIRAYLQEFFMEGFLDKGRFRPHLQKIPVHVILDPLNGFKGAAWGARHHLLKNVEH